MRLRRKSIRKCAILIGGFLFLIGAIGFYLNAKNQTSALAEVNSDVWSIDYQIYDDTDGNGLTATDNIDWVIPASQQDESLQRDFLFQINYRAPVVDRDYEPGELELRMPLAFKRPTDYYSGYINLLYDGIIVDDIGRTYDDFGGIVTTNDVLFGARPVGTSLGDYDWEYECIDYKKLPRGEKPYCLFRNLKPIQKDSSIEGAIQVTYKIRTRGSGSAPMFREQFSEIYYNPDMKVVLNDAVESNPVTLRIEHEREVEWQKNKYTVHVRHQPLQSIDGLGEGAEDYIWVRYFFYGNGENNASYELPYYNPDEHYYNAVQNQLIPVKNYAFYDSFSEGVLVLDNNKQPMSRDENGEFRVSDSPVKTFTDSCKPLGVFYGYYSTTCFDVFVGYPRSIYGDEEGKISQISNTVYSRGIYFLEDELSALDDESLSFNIGDFDFDYKGNQVAVSKSVLSSKFGLGNVRPNISHQANQTEEGSTVFFDLGASALNIRKLPYDLVVADDLLYIEDADTGEINRLSEDDYSFKTVHIYTSVTLTNGEAFDCRDYKKANIYYRLRGENEFRLLTHSNGSGWTACSTGGTGLNFSLPDNVVDVKYVLRDMWTGVRSFRIGVELNIKSDTLPRHGKVHNFDYVDLVYDDVQQNIPSIDDYATQTTKDLVATYDLERYGIYKQRAHAAVEYESKTLGKVLTDNQSGVVYSGEAIYDSATDSFLGYMTTGGYVTQLSSDSETNLKALKSMMTDDNYIRSVEWFVMVPKGMEVTSTEEEIGKSFSRCRIRDDHSPFPNHDLIFGMTDEPVFESEQECLDYINSHSDVTISKNWRDTGVTLIRIHLDFSEKPFSNMNAQRDYLNPSVWFEGAQIAYKIPYEVYAENDANTTQDNRYRYIVSTFAPNDGSYKTWDHHLNSGTYYRGYSKDDGHYTRYYDWKYLYEPAFADMDEDGDTDEEMDMGQDDMTLALSMAVQQELKKTVSTDLTNAFSTDESMVSAGGTYQHKLSIRTGSNNATDIVLYDNIETAYENNAHWQGVFNGVDTSFAESLTDNNGKGIVVEVYYSAKDDADSLGDDSSWAPYIEGETDKSNVRSLAFKIMNADGNAATLSAQKYLHVLINMTAPGEDDGATGLAYNSFRSTWKPLSPVSGEAVMGVEGINSNTVTVKLDVSEPEVPEPEPEPTPENPGTGEKVYVFVGMIVLFGAVAICIKKAKY